MALSGFGSHEHVTGDSLCWCIEPVLTDGELRANAVKAARTILARHAGCRCSLCDLARSIELNLEGVTYER